MNKLLRSLFNSPTFTTWSSFVVQFGSSVFILPLVLIKFSDAEIAAWFLLYMLINLSMLADSGFGPTIVRAVSYYYSGAATIPKNISEFNDRKISESGTINFVQLKRLIGILNTVYLILGLFSVFLIVVFGRYIVANTFKMSDSSSHLYAAFYLVVIRAFLSIQAVKWISFIQGIDRVANIKRAEALFNLIKLLVMFFLVLSGYKVFSLMLVETFYGAMMLLFSWSYVSLWFKKNGHTIGLKFSFHKETIKTIWPSTWRLGSIQYGSYLINYGSGIIISQVKNAETIAGFMLAQRIIFFIRQVSQAPIYANLPRIFQLMSKRDFEEIRKFSIKGIRISLIILLFSLVFFVVAGNHIFAFMNIKTRLPEMLVLSIMCFSIILEMHHSIHAQIYMGTNYIPFLIPTVVSGVIILFGGFMTVGHYGIIGVVLVQFAVQVCFNNWYSVFLNTKLLGWSFSGYICDLTGISRKATF